MFFKGLENGIILFCTKLEPDQLNSFKNTTIISKQNGGCTNDDGDLDVRRMII